MIAGGWRLAKVKPTLPPVQVVQDHALEWQHFVDQAFDHGALRLCVSPGKKGGETFALLVDTRVPQYADFARVASTERYASYRDGPYVVVLPVRPVTPKLFDTLRGKRWTEDQLQERLGTPSAKGHIHGAGLFVLEYVPQGLSFMGDQLGPGGPFEYEYEIIDAEWEKQLAFELPSLESLSRLDYTKLQEERREKFARELLWIRKQIDAALAAAKVSPGGHFLAGHVNLAGSRIRRRS